MAAPASVAQPETPAGPPPPGVFVTGTGTEVGKTVVAATIARMGASKGRRVRVFKPAVTGLDEFAGRAEARPEWASADQLPDHTLLKLAAGSVQPDEQVAPHRFGPAVSPHLAAELAGEPIDPVALLAAARGAAADAELFVCEGVGGFLVPLSREYLVRDLARDLGMPVVIAAPPGLGAINHSLLTIDSARAAGLQVLSVVLTPWPQAPGEIERSNLEAISRLGKVAVQTLPPLELTRPETWPEL
jgi:dethiobiotin synthetase